MKIDLVGEYFVCEFDVEDIREAYEFIVNNFDDDGDDIHRAFEFWTNERVEYYGYA
jgi:hypothetical protein